MVGSKEKASECGLVGKSDVWVKGKAVGVWSDKKKRRLGQRERHRSVVWKEKPPLGSKGKASECGLARENRRLGQRERHRSVVWQGKTAAWVKEEALGVWPGKGKLPPGSKRKPSECGLARENCRLGQRESPRSVV